MYSMFCNYCRRGEEAFYRALYRMLRRLLDGLQPRQRQSIILLVFEHLRLVLASNPPGEHPNRDAAAHVHTEHSVDVKQPTSGQQEKQPTSDDDAGSVSNDNVQNGFRMDSSSHEPQQDTSSNGANGSELSADYRKLPADWRTHFPLNWVNLIETDLNRQRLMQTQHPLSDAYLSGMPAKRRKVITCYVNY
ncbi:unnamed protein product [Soboliphyme baturini]|uniref:CCR4-NOT transcription complex subunit 11 n=1 Tax=Soboliphyme baturini TaxID=241478 RepID=A0A183JAR6_9BILA|nr:unnamed protein product [Soboliphyme baturini]